MPLFHVHGLLAGLLAPLASSGSIVIPPKFAASSFWKEFIATKSNVRFPSRSLTLCADQFLDVVVHGCGTLAYRGIGALAHHLHFQPTVHQILLRSPHPSPLPDIRFIRSCSSALSATTHGEVEKAFKVRSSSDTTEATADAVNRRLSSKHTPFVDSSTGNDER